MKIYRIYLTASFDKLLGILSLDLYYDENFFAIMDWTTPLKAQQADFIERLKYFCLLHCEKNGQHSELTIISGEKLLQLRAFCWQMAEKYKRTSSVRDVFINNLKGKLGEEVVKARLGNFVTEVDYEKRIGGDSKVDFRLTSQPSVGIQVKARSGSIDTVKWCITKEEIEKNSVLVCVLIQEQVDEAQSEYNLILAGFLPTNMISINCEAVSLGISSLLYASGLHSYLSSLNTSQSRDTLQDDTMAKLQQNDKANTQQTEDYIKNETVNLIIDYFSLANKYLKQGAYQNALVHYNQVLQLNQNISEALFGCSYAFSQIGDIEAAIDSLNQAISVNPVNDKFYFHRGDLRYNIGDIQGAIEDFNTGVNINPDNAYALYRRGSLHYEIGDNEAAVQDYDKSLIINPQLADAYWSRGFIRYHYIKDTQDAIEDFTHAIRINPNCVEAYYWRGAARYDKRIDKGAIIDFTQVIKLNPQCDSAYLRRGIIFAELGEYQKAIGDFDFTLSINSNLAEAYKHRGSTYYNLGHIEFAIKDLQKAANIYKQQGRDEAYEDVIEMLKNAYDLHSYRQEL